MKRFTGFSVAALAAAVVLVVVFVSSPLPGPPVMAQTVPAAPGNQQARNTGTAGVVEVTWDAVDGADAYRVGWLNHQDFEEAGSEWLQRFTFAQVPGTLREYEVTRLAPGDEYWFIVASVDDKGRAYWPAGWIQKFRVSGVPLPTAHCPGAPSDGTGAYCPITGLRVVDAHYGIGEEVTWDEFKLTVTDGELLVPGRYHQYYGDSRLGVGDDFYYLPIVAGRRYLRLKVAIVNDERHVQLQPGREYAMGTNTGVAFVVGGERIINKGTNGSTELLFEIPASASTAVLAMRPLYHRTDVDSNEPKLIQIQIQGLAVIPGRIVPDR